MTDLELAELAKSLAAPTRIAILRAIAERALCVDAIARHAGITPSAASQHLRRLAAVGLVAGERLGYHVHYGLCAEGIGRLCEELDRLRSASAAHTCRSACGCVEQGEERGDA